MKILLMLHFLFQLLPLGLYVNFDNTFFCLRQRSLRFVFQCTLGICSLCIICKGKQPLYNKGPFINGLRMVYKWLINWLLSGL